MATTDSSSGSNTGNISLNAIFSSLQQGVVGINNLTQTMKSIFPSS